MTNPAEHTSALTERCDKLSQVDSCLAGLYARAVENEGALPTVKTVLLDLIIYAPDPRTADMAAGHASLVLPSRPCRAIIVEAGSSAPSGSAVVTVMCGISERGDRRLCGEMIHVHAGRGTATGAVMPLLVPDVPVYLWVVGDIPPEREDFGDLLRVSSHVIVDSRRFSDLPRGIRAAAGLLTSESNRRIVQDLSWVSLREWREATAEHFDAPAVRHHLGQLVDVTIVCSCREDGLFPDSPPLLLASWLIERLQLQIVSVFHSRDEGYRIEAVQDGHRVVVRIVPEESPREAGKPLSMMVRCGSGDERASFGTESVSETELLLTEECHEVCLPPKSLAMVREDDVALAVQALGQYRRDHTYESALAVALKIISQIELGDESATSLRL